MLCLGNVVGVRVVVGCWGVRNFIDDRFLVEIDSGCEWMVVYVKVNGFVNVVIGVGMNE